MKEKSLDAIGTVQGNRSGLPVGRKLLGNSGGSVKIGGHPYRRMRMDKGDSHSWTSEDQLCFMKWNDSNIFCMLSTYANTRDSIEVMRRRGPVQAPLIAHDYNQHMGGEDVSDANWKRYRCGFKGQSRWYLHHLYYLLDLYVEQSRIVYTNTVQQSVSSLDFRMEAC